MRYSALAPGKRLRPALVFLSAAAVSPTEVPGVELAAASVELVHAFSLIHDDLPAIDNDDLRRGRPTCHRQFDEATAILAGDALFALAFRMALEAPNGAAVAAVLADGVRTADIAAKGQNAVGTTDMGDAVVKALGKAAH